MLFCNVVFSHKRMLARDGAYEHLDYIVSETKIKLPPGQIK
jgi:hypothetical protein